MIKTLTAVAALGLATGSAFAELGSTREHSEQTFGLPVETYSNGALYHWQDWYISETYNSAGRCEVCSYNRPVPFAYKTIRRMDEFNLPAGAADDMVELPCDYNQNRIWQTRDGAYRVTGGSGTFNWGGHKGLYYYRFYATAAGWQILSSELNNSSSY
jgi:hypothetical protein